LHGNCTVGIRLLLGEMGEGSLVVKGVKGEFSNTGTGGNISRGDHPSGSIWSHDTRLTLFVKGMTVGISMICFEKP